MQAWQTAVVLLRFSTPTIEGNNMNKLKYALLALVMGSSYTVADDCTSPEAPTLPDGATSSMEDMLAGQKAVKEFQAANLEYMGCVEQTISAAEEATLKASDEDKEAAQAAHQKAMEAYNAAVSQEEEVAGQFNTEIREYKAANPG
jgi:hypothetical protein